MVVLSSPNGNTLLIYDANKTPIVQAALPKFEILSVGYYTFTSAGVKYSLTFEQVRAGVVFPVRMPSQLVLATRRAPTLTRAQTRALSASSEFPAVCE